MSGQDEFDIFREAARISWAEQVRTAGVEPTTGRDIVLERLRQSAKQMTKTEPERRADVVLGYIEDSLRVAAPAKLTDVQGDALAFLHANLVSYMAERKLPLPGPQEIAFLSMTLFIGYFLGRSSASER